MYSSYSRIEDLVRNSDWIFLFFSFFSFVSNSELFLYNIQNLLHLLPRLTDSDWHLLRFSFRV